MARLYSDIHVCPTGQHGKVAMGCTCNPGEGERVTAIDERDVAPLAEAARNANALLWAARVKGPAVQAEAYESSRAILGAALATFEGGER
jgi:hypothetical protein